MYSCIHLLSPFPFLSLSIYLSLWLESTQTHSIAAQSGSVRFGPRRSLSLHYAVMLNERS